MSHARLPIVVVGSGAAGLVTALAAAPAPIRLLCRAHDGSGSTSTLAQGGIAAALNPSDSPQAHARDTLQAENKQQVTLRLDADVLSYFRYSGTRSQTRISQVLRTYMQAHTGKWP